MRLDNNPSWPSADDEAGVFDIFRGLAPGAEELQQHAAAKQCKVAIIRLTSPNAVLLRLSFMEPKVAKSAAFGIMGGSFIRWFSGEAGDLYAVNQRIALALPQEAGAEAQVTVYLGLYLETSRGNAGWRSVENIEEVEWLWGPSKRRQNMVAQAIKPISARTRCEKGWVCETVIQRRGELVTRDYLVSPDGFVSFLSEQPLLKLKSLAAPSGFTAAEKFAPIMASVFGIENEAGLLCGFTELQPKEENVEEEDDLIVDIDGLNTDEAASHATEEKPNYNNLLEQVAAMLLKNAIEVVDLKKPQKPSADPVQDFFDYLKKYRPTVAIVSPYRELQLEFARIFAQACGMYMELRWQTGPQNSYSDLSSERPAVVLLTDATFRSNYEEAEVDAGRQLSSLISGPHIGLIATERVRSLPQDARDMIDITLAVPRINSEQFQTLTHSIFEQNTDAAFPAEDWMQYVLPRDIARAATAAGELSLYLFELRNTVGRRLAQYTAPDAPSLSDLNGLGQALDAMESLMMDIRAALDHEIGWDQVDRGYLLVGPPGTGKTTLVRALAKDCGIRFVLASAGQWQEGGSLGPHIQNIRRTFREARLYAPSILFIDEIDSLGARGQIEAHNSQYQTVVINTVLEELQGFDGRDGIIAIGATNNIKDVDPAIRRPGRLDHIVEVPYPNITALAGIYDYYLKKAAAKGTEIAPIDTTRLAQMTFGGTGAHIEVNVRGAVRRARRERRSVTEEDLLAEILNRPANGSGPRLAPVSLHRVAVHEAGHALLCLTSTIVNRPVAMVSITPRADGTLGFVARVADERAFLTQLQMEEEVRIALAGRAAEEIVFGQDQVSSGAGGPVGSDLQVASLMVTRMLTQFGFSKIHGLLWLNWLSEERERTLTAEAIRNLPLGEEVLQETHETLERLYRETVSRLAEKRDALDRVVQLLIDRQDVSTPELNEALLAVDTHPSL